MTNPDIRALIKAADDLRRDMLMRGEKDEDGTVIVNAGFSVWSRFNTSLREAKVKYG